ncbi:Retrovirus-related Pol polyprotein from transposon RE1 [Senna tora]|uniref:Retrovirus-related Pol polyprotein from transposon RE1 n=1 Tax=Senna tora TaxID=362788 RepID=A0A834SVG2_9FABA|nr:Retrovirus-related Pol polyprotein from transposon RE1 [Senna tora]
MAEVSIREEDLLMVGPPNGVLNSFRGNYQGRGGRGQTPGQGRGGRGRTWQNGGRPQCQICGKFGHIGVNCHNRMPNHTMAQQVNIANGTGLEITCIGSSELLTNSQSLKLNQLLHVPEVDHQVLLEGKNRQGLYVFGNLQFLHKSSQPSASVNIASSFLDSSQFGIWYSRLGHPSAQIDHSSSSLPLATPSTIVVSSSLLHHNKTCFISTQCDNSLFIKNEGTLTLFVLVYVDNVIVTGFSLKAIKYLIAALNAKFVLKDLGNLHYFLGIEARDTSNGGLLLTRKYIKDLLAKTDMTDASSQKIPMTAGLKLSSSDSETFQDPHKYLTGTIDYGLHGSTYSSQILFISAPSLMLTGAQMWMIEDPPQAGASILARTLSEVAWIQSLLSKLQCPLSQVPHIYCNNLSSVLLLANPILHTKFPSMLNSTSISFGKELQRGRFMSCKSQLRIKLQIFSPKHYPTLCSVILEPNLECHLLPLWV